MYRAARLSLEFLTARKRNIIDTLIQSYRAAVNFYIKSLWDNPGDLDKATFDRLGRTRLTARQKSEALKQALETVAATKAAVSATGQTASCPHYTGPAIFDKKFVTIEHGRGSFIRSSH